ncbi:MAG: DUF1315 family protein [Halioglobus sp.]|nr:DUF1315 family protein [Halioglobus sp.]
MDYQQLIENMSPELYRSLLRAVETGKWPDGRVVTPEQRENALQAVIAWGEQHLQPDERVGFIDRGHKAGDACDEPAPLKFVDEEKCGG